MACFLRRSGGTGVVVQLDMYEEEGLEQLLVLEWTWDWTECEDTPNTVYLNTVYCGAGVCFPGSRDLVARAMQSML